MNNDIYNKMSLGSGGAESESAFRKFQHTLPVRLLVKGFLIATKYLPVRLLGILLICILIFSCAKKQIIRQADLEPYTGPVTIETLKQFIGFRTVTSIKSFVDVRIYREGELAGSFNGVFAYKSSGHMRISLFGPFGLTMMELLISKDLFQTYIPPKDIIYEWKSPDVSFSMLLDDRFRYDMEDTGNMFVLYAYKSKDSNSELIAEYLFDRTYLINRSIIFYKDGRKIIRVDFNSFNGMIPEKIKISFRNSSAMEIFLQDPEFDTDIPDDYFRPVEHADKEVLPFQDVLKSFDAGS